jgi:TM2 domain-containing membrane protein YozV
MFFASNSKYFPNEKMMIIRDKMSTLDDTRYAVISSIELKDPTTLLLISIFLGFLGVDRFMLKQTGMGVLKLLTAGLCGILWLIDVITITRKTKDFNYNAIMQVM